MISHGLMILVHEVVTKEIVVLEKTNSNMCKDVIEKELLQSHVKNDLHEDLKFQSELRHALDVVIDEHAKC